MKIFYFILISILSFSHGYAIDFPTGKNYKFEGGVIESCTRDRGQVVNIKEIPDEQDIKVQEKNGYLVTRDCFSLQCKKGGKTSSPQRFCRLTQTSLGENSNPSNLNVNGPKIQECKEGGGIPDSVTLMNSTFGEVLKKGMRKTCYSFKCFFGTVSGPTIIDCEIKNISKDELIGKNDSAEKISGNQPFDGNKKIVSHRNSCTLHEDGTCAKPGRIYKATPDGASALANDIMKALAPAVGGNSQGNNTISEDDLKKIISIKEFTE